MRRVKSHQSFADVSHHRQNAHFGTHHPSGAVFGADSAGNFAMPPPASHSLIRASPSMPSFPVVQPQTSSESFERGPLTNIREEMGEEIMQGMPSLGEVPFMDDADAQSDDLLNLMKDLTDPDGLGGTGLDDLDLALAAGAPVASEPSKRESEGGAGVQAAPATSDAAANAGAQDAAPSSSALMPDILDLDADLGFDDDFSSAFMDS
jgi:hypothetical protein